MHRFLFSLCVATTTLFLAQHGRADDAPGPDATSPIAASPDAAAPKSAETGQKHELKYKFTTGETLRWEVTQVATVQTTIQESMQKANMCSESVKVWRVTDVTPDGDATLIHSVESVKMSNRLPERADVNYDSQTDADPPAAFADVAAAIGAPLTMIRLNPHGKVLKREQRHPQPAASKHSLIATPLPGEAVPVGHSWTANQSIQVTAKGGIPRRIKVRRRFELQEVKDHLATIGVEFQVLDPQVRRDPTILAQLVGQQVKGTLTFDMQRGRTVAQALKLDQRVLDFAGPSSRMHYVMRFTERLLKPNEKLAQRPPKPAGPEQAPAVDLSDAKTKDGRTTESTK